MSEDETQSIKNNIIDRLRKYGSVELVANLATMEIHHQSFPFHNPSNTMSENPLTLYAAGLFLSNHNLGAGEPDGDQLEDFIALLEKYFETFRLSLMQSIRPDTASNDIIRFASQLQKIIDDENPRAYPGQKQDYFKRVLHPLDGHFVSKFGFSTLDAVRFGYVILRRVSDQMAKNAASHTERQESETQNSVRFECSKDILTINMDDYCKEQNISDLDVFSSYLNAFSCTFGEQFEEFEDPLSDNILHCNPIIKLGNNAFFTPKPDLLYQSPDRLLEHLLKKEKQTNPAIWNRFSTLKSKYLEDMTFDFLGRVFPKECISRNLYYWTGEGKFEIDLLVKYDNKILIAESKSGGLPMHVKREGRKQLVTRLETLVKEAAMQASRCKDYINSSQTARFWNNSRDKIILEIDSSETNYEFFFINVTWEHLGSFAANLRSLDALNLFDGNHPWSVYLYDLDVVTNLLEHPIYFIHYVEQRLAFQKQDVFESESELSTLGFYLQCGNFQGLNLACPNTSVQLTPDFMDPIEEYYMAGKIKPRLAIPKELEILLLNMQKYRQKNFTKVTGLLLDLPPEAKDLVARKLAKVFKKISQSKVPDGFTVMADEPYNIGFSYLTSNTMKYFYPSVVQRLKLQKMKHGNVRWAMIGRNTTDKKNHATFFICDGVSSSNYGAAH